MIDSDNPRYKAQREFARAVARPTQTPVMSWVALKTTWPFTPEEQQMLVNRIATDKRFVLLALKVITRLTDAQRSQLEKLVN